jgi:O-Antigen ligase
LATLVVAFSLVLLRLATLVGGDTPSTIEKFLPLAPFLFIVMARLALPSRWNLSVGRLALIVGVMALLMVSVLRGVGAETEVAGQGSIFSGQSAAIQIARDLLIFVFGLVVFVRDDRPARRRQALRALCWAPSIYVAANVVFYLAGIHSARVSPEPVTQHCEMLGLVGITHFRTFFPMAVGVNTFGIMVGLALASSIILAVRNVGLTRNLAILALAVNFYAILLTDSRGPLFFSIAAAVSVLLIGSRVSDRFSRVAFLVPFSPLIVIGALGLLQNVAEPSSGVGRGSLGTGSNRLFVWEPILRFLGSFSPEQMIGYGQFGQVTSGVASEYRYLFREESYVPAAHNFVLQTVLDIGYLGLAVVVAAFAMLIRMFLTAAKHGSIVAGALLASLLSLILVGFTEAAPTVYSLEAYFFFILLLAVGANRDLAVDEEPAPAKVPIGAWQRQRRPAFAGPSLGAQLRQSTAVDD